MSLQSSDKQCEEFQPSKDPYRVEEAVDAAKFTIGASLDVDGGIIVG